MQKISAGLLMYKLVNDELKVFIAHPGGPFWKDKNEGAWSIPKGEPNEEEDDLLKVAIREFKEETGIDASRKEFIELGSAQQKSGKIVHCWAFEGDWSGLLMCSTYVNLEFPSHSKKFIKFPEIDRAGFFNFEEAKKKINPAQIAFLERLEVKLQTPSAQ
jgi:predicted NUDIX family NTP pyrophosphohydrolase